MKYKVVIYGIGEKYNKNLNVIKYFEILKQIEVVGITARWVPDSVCLDDYKIIKYEYLCKIEFDYIVVMSDIYFNEIVETLIKSGIERDKLISYRVF